jgi:hypothetical protein
VLGFGGRQVLDLHLRKNRYRDGLMILRGAWLGRLAAQGAVVGVGHGGIFEGVLLF